MTPTSDERREVARRLRTEVSEGECIDYAVFRIVHDVMGVEDAMGARAGRILADLIDPTCHVRGYGHPDEFRVVRGCSACNCGWYEDVYARPYRFCPHCGARLVDRGER